MESERFEYFFSCIAGIYREIQRLKTSFANGLEIKSVHIFWLYLLYMHPEGMTASELARASQTNRSLVSREMSELVAGGFVSEAEENGKRKYAGKMRLTQAGNAVGASIRSTALNVQNVVNRDISQEELVIFNRVLGILLRRFEALPDGRNEEMESEDESCRSTL